MPAITNKQQLLTQAQAALKKRFPLPELEPEAPRALLEELIYAICREGSTTADADAAYERLRKVFVDWNEIRVSTVQEVADALRPLPNSGLRSGWIIGVLHAVFEMNYSYDLGDMEKKGLGLKQAAKQLSRYFNEKDLKTLKLERAAKQIGRFKQVNDFAVAWVVQRALGGHAIPLDGPTLRVLFRLGVIEDADVEDMEAVRGSVEHVIPKARGPEFTELMSVHAKEICIDKTPLCPQCPLKSDCPTGIENLKKPEKDKTDTKPKKPR